MELVFERTGERRYSIVAHRPGLRSALMDPAPGYDPFLPHDVMHMVVEAELGLKHGVFGQLAAGGLSGTFRVLPDSGASNRDSSRQKRRAEARDEVLLKKGRKDSAVSEWATYLCWYEWLTRSNETARRNEAKLMKANAEHVEGTVSSEELKRLSSPVMDRICERLDLLSSCWSSVPVRGKMVVKWPELTILPSP